VDRSEKNAPRGERKSEGRIKEEENTRDEEEKKSGLVFYLQLKKRCGGQDGCQVPAQKKNAQKIGRVKRLAKRNRASYAGRPGTENAHGEKNQGGVGHQWDEPVSYLRMNAATWTTSYKSGPDQKA